MRRFLIQRLLSVVPVFFGVTFLAFLLIHLTPGDYLTNLSLNPQISPQTIENLRRDFGLDHPWHHQYFIWLYRLLPVELPFGIKWPDLGYSFANHVPVFDLIKSRFPNTLILSFSAEMLSWIIAMPMGLFAASRKNLLPDRVFSFSMVIGISMPQILLALVALLLAARTGWFPVGGMHSLYHELLPWTGRMLDLLHHLILPAVVLALPEAAMLAQYFRSSMIQAISEDYIRTARAKGNSQNRVLLKHAFKNAMNPMIAMIGLSFASLVSGTFLVEIIFNWPGMGRLMFDALLARDIHVVLASLLISTLFLLMGNFFADLLLAISDPRIRYEP